MAVAFVGEPEAEEKVETVGTTRSRVSVVVAELVLVGPVLAAASVTPLATRRGWRVPVAEQVVTVMMSNYALKVGWEVVNTPITYRVVNFLKRAESEDYYDRDTNFTPFALKA